MSTGRILWVLWCALWCIFWITLGWVLLPVANVFMFVLSLVLMIPAFIRGRP